VFASPAGALGTDEKCPATGHARGPRNRVYRAPSDPHERQRRQPAVGADERIAEGRFPTPREWVAGGRIDEAPPSNDAPAGASNGVAAAGISSAGGNGFLAEQADFRPSNRIYIPAVTCRLRAVGLPPCAVLEFPTDNSSLHRNIILWRRIAVVCVRTESALSAARMFLDDAILRPPHP
jgi:hypothetical protein